MKLIENIDISLSLNKGKIEIMFESVEEILGYYSPAQELIQVLMSAEEDGCIGFVKALSFRDDKFFLQLYKKRGHLDEYKVIHEQIRFYRGYILPFINESDFRFKMMAIDNEGKEELLKVADFI